MVSTFFLVRQGTNQEYNPWHSKPTNPSQTCNPSPWQTAQNFVFDTPHGIDVRPSSFWHNVTAYCIVSNTKLSNWLWPRLDRGRTRNSGLDGVRFSLIIDHPSTVNGWNPTRHVELYISSDLLPVSNCIFIWTSFTLLVTSKNRGNYGRAKVALPPNSVFIHNYTDLGITQLRALQPWLPTKLHSRMGIYVRQGIGLVRQSHYQ